MKEHITEPSCIVALRMLLDRNNAVVLVVEGHEDKKLIESRLEHSLEIMCAGGRNAVLDAARALKGDGVFRNVRYLIDSDFDRFHNEWNDHLNKNDPYPSGVLSTGEHDLWMECIEADSQLLERAMSGYVQNIGDARSLVSKALGFARRISGLKLAADLLGYRLEYKSCNNTDLTEGSWDYDLLVDFFLKQNKGCEVDRSRWIEVAEQIVDRLGSLYTNPTGDHLLFLLLASLCGDKRRAGERDIRRSVYSALDVGSILRIRCIQEINYWCEEAGVQGLRPYGT